MADKFFVRSSDFLYTVGDEREKVEWEVSKQSRRGKAAAAGAAPQEPEFEQHTTGFGSRILRERQGYEGTGAAPVDQFLALRDEADDYDSSGHGIGYMPPPGTVPLTRAFLASYYDRRPYYPMLLSIDWRVSSQVRDLSSKLLSQLPPDEGEKLLVEEADRSPPLKIDENLWKIRECLQEIIFLLEKPWPPEEIAMFSGIPFQEHFDLLGSHQAADSKLVLRTVMSYLPRDFRELVRKQWEDLENKQAAVVTGTVQERYTMLWKHQMHRRRLLANLGSGVYKKYFVTVPQVLLDFLKKINDDDGPLEEQRRRYGPPLYSLTSMVLSIRLFLALYWRRFETIKLERIEVDVLEQAVEKFDPELRGYIAFISGVFRESPFLISSAQAGAIQASDSDDFEEISIAAGKTHEVSLTVDSLNSYIAWDFSLVQGDIGFSVECVSPSGQKSVILPYHRYEANQGNLSKLVTGNYKLIWDNSSAVSLEKALRYKVDCIPPLPEAEG